MVTQADRAAERRWAIVKGVRRQVNDGALGICEMTRDARRLHLAAAKGRRK
jgi:hypothetical protein